MVKTNLKELPIQELLNNYLNLVNKLELLLKVALFLSNEFKSYFSNTMVCVPLFHFLEMKACVQF